MLQRILYSFFSKGAVAIINFLVLLISARYLGVRTRGEISVFLINIVLVQVITEVYTGYSLVHFLQKFNHRKLIWTGLLIIVLTSLLAGFLLPLRSALVLESYFYFPILLLVLLHSFFCVLLLGKQRLRMYNLISLAQPFLLLTFLAFLIFVSRNFTFKAYYIALTASFFFALPLSAFLVYRAFRGSVVFPEYSFKGVAAKGLYFQAGTLMLLFINRYNYYVLGVTEKIGLYATACALMEACLLITSAASPVLLARLSVIPNAGMLLLRILRLAVLSLLLLYGACWLIPESLLLLLVGKGYTGIRLVMLSYGPSVVFQGACMLLGQYYSAKGKQAQLVKLYFIPFIIHLFLAPLLIGYMGITGAAVASAFTFLLVFLRLYFNFCTAENLSAQFPLQRFSLIKEIRNLLHND
jgi:O-antigen/teichoic acid export membrane protein